jgi:hypothetical protein
LHAQLLSLKPCKVTAVVPQGLNPVPRDRQQPGQGWINAAGILQLAPKALDGLERVDNQPQVCQGAQLPERQP